MTFCLLTMPRMKILFFIASYHVALNWISEIFTVLVCMSSFVVVSIQDVLHYIATDSVIRCWLLMKWFSQVRFMMIHLRCWYCNERRIWASVNYLSTQRNLEHLRWKAAMIWRNISNISSFIFYNIFLPTSKALSVLTALLDIIQIKK